MVRFCPFCSAENPAEAGQCVACKRVLPALPARKVPTVPGLPLPPPSAETPAPLVVPPPRRSLSIPAPGPAPGGIALPRPLPASLGEVAPTTVAPPPDFTPLPPPPQPPEEHLEISRVRAPAPSEVADTPHSRAATEASLAERARALPPMPAVPHGGPHHTVLYAIEVIRARMRRASLVRALQGEVAQHTGALETVFAALGKTAREISLAGKPFAEENQGIDEAERRRRFAEQSLAELTGSKVEENAKFEKVEKDLSARLADRESVYTDLARELLRLEDERKTLRERRRVIDRQHKQILDGGKNQGPAAASDARRAADRLAGERAEIDGRLGKLDRPIDDLSVRVRDARADVDSRKKDLANAREGHRHRIAELEAAAAGRLRELQQAEGEIVRRTVTLGTILNLNRVDRAELGPHYAQADSLRAQIYLRQGEIDRLIVERDAFDRGSALRGTGILILALLIVVTAVWLVVKLL
jgi:hypothetical protein